MDNCTVRDKTWDNVLRLMHNGVTEFTADDLDIHKSDMHTARRTLRTMVTLGWLDTPKRGVYRAGELAEQTLDIEE
jgi:hypothetical protein